MRFVLGVAVGVVFATMFLMPVAPVKPSEADINDLLSVGFVLIDPEGCEVSRFDD